MLVVGKRNQLHASLLESLFGHREAIGERGHHTYHLYAIFAKGSYSFQRRATSRDQILDHDHLGTLFDFTFYLITHAVIFRFRTHIGKGQAECISHQSTLRDGSRSNTGDGLYLRIVLEDQTHQAQLHIRAHLGIGVHLAVITIDGRLPAARPCERLLRSQLDSFDLQ